MPLKQSAFNFDFPPEENIPEPMPVVQEKEVIIEKQEAGEPVREIVLETVVKRSVAAKDSLKKSPRGRMKLSDMGALADQPEIPADEVLFEKRYYSIGAVSEMFKVNQSLIRYWKMNLIF